MRAAPRGRRCLISMALLVTPAGAWAQALSQRPPMRYELGVGVGRLSERYCASCPSGPRTTGPALLARASRALGRVLEAGAEVHASGGEGRHFEAAFASVALTAPVEYAAWLRGGAGLLLQPGTGADVTATSGPAVRQNGTEAALGFLVGVGLDIPVGRHSLSPQVSFVRHSGKQGRFDYVSLGVGLRFFRSLPPAK